ncbi:hypothetical protein CONLIGDRAFT_679002 [Coniochaeta ligniaria NRRL 30616]|uniref:Uncharacterized protein n=1 Tax=Coniochaeta ligniaria NRRL 30616 TaxID=1408157 RepID=A0A1J7JXT2_9PEZI|nr:hypothetical protein CONLIGDRAFT_679002 [Coniochaeta ligniaria NRRL 30616]
MTTHATLTIHNTSNTLKSFYLAQSPFPLQSGPDEPYSTHVYLSVPPIPSGGFVQFAFQDGDYSALLSYNSTPGDPLSAQESKPVVLGMATGPGGSVVTVTSSDAGVQATFGPDEEPEDTPGGFTVVTDNSFPFPNDGNITIGVGKQNPGSNAVTPTQTWAAQPGLKTQVYPQPRYFVAFGEAKQGTVVELDLLGNVLQVDYTDCTVPDARFDLNDEGLYVADPTVAKNGIGWVYGPLGGK